MYRSESHYQWEFQKELPVTVTGHARKGRVNERTICKKVHPRHSNISFLWYNRPESWWIASFLTMTLKSFLRHITTNRLPSFDINHMIGGQQPPSQIACSDVDTATGAFPVQMRQRHLSIKRCKTRFYNLYNLKPEGRSKHNALDGIGKWEQHPLP